MIKQKKSSFSPKVLFVGILFLLGIFSFWFVNNPNQLFDIRQRAAGSSQPFVIYDNSLAPGWTNWSFDAKVNTSFTDLLNKVIKVDITRRYGGLYLHSNSSLSPQSWDTLEFSLKAAMEGQKFGVRIQTVSDRQIGAEVMLSEVGGNPKAGEWKNYSIPLELFSRRFTQSIGGVIIQEELGRAPQTYFVDNIRLVSTVPVVTPILSPMPSPVPAIPTAVPTPRITSAVPTSPNVPTIRPTAVPTATVPTSGRVYPWHTGIISTTFWVGEIFNANLSDGSQVCSTYDSNWAFHWSGVNKGTVSNNASGCPGSIYGGCDGVANAAGTSCATERRTAANNYFPSQGSPRENPFYLDLPFDDINDSTAYRERCTVIPWANDAGYAGNCTNQNFSYMKNRWVRIVGPNGNTCYGQIQDAGPSHDNLYHDAAYVFGSNDARPIQGQFNNAGMDVSPALNGCLGFSSLDGDGDKVNWQWVDAVDVPAGPWKMVVTTSQVSQ